MGLYIRRGSAACLTRRAAARTASAREERSQQRLFPEMNLMLQVTFLGLLSLLVQGWVHNRSLQSERWSALDLSQNRELFLSALQSYFSSRGIYIEKTAPAFVLSTRNRNQGEQEDQELVAPERGVGD